MKKLLLLFSMLILTCSVYAEQTVGKYQNTYFGKEFEIEAAQKNDKLQSVYIGIEAKDAKYAFISVDGKDLELFKVALELVKAKYLDWMKVAKENNVTEMDKEFDIKFPSVSVAWSGSKWWFSFGQKIKMRFLILDSGKMIAVWAPDGVTAGLQPEKEPVAGFLRRGGEGDVEPVVGVLAPDGVLPAPGHPVPLRRGIGGLVARGQAGNAFQGIRGGLPERRQLLNDDTDLLK